MNDPQIAPMTTTAPMPAVEPLSEDVSPRDRDWMRRFRMILFEHMDYAAFDVPTAKRHERVEDGVRVPGAAMED